MPTDVRLSPNFFVPRWERDDDPVYLVVQPAVAADGAGAAAALADYLAGFSVPAAAGAAAAVAVALADGPQPAVLVPVPLPDAVTLTVTPTVGGAPSPDLPPLVRRLDGFARLRSFPAWVAANRTFPREFLRTEVRGVGRTQQRVYPRWWRDPAEPPDFPPAGYEGATFAQVLAHQTRLAWARAENPAEGAARAREQLASSFLVGRLLRLFADGGDRLFDGLAVDPAADLMVVPDLAPGESWDAALADVTRRHANAAGLCGLSWPVATRGQLRTLPADRLPDGFTIQLAPVAGSNWTVAGGPLTFPPSGGAVGQYFADLKAAAGGPLPPPAVAVGPVPHLRGVDFGRVAFLQNKTRNLPPDGATAAALAAAAAGHTAAYVVPAAAQPGETAADAERARAAATTADPVSDAEFLAADDLLSVSVVTADLAADVPLTFWVVVPGRLARYRSFADPAGANHLRQFVPDLGLPADVLAVVRDRVRADGPAGPPVVLVRRPTATAPDPRLADDVRDVWVHDEPAAANLYQPVFFLSRPGGAGLDDAVLLATEVGTATAAAVRRDESGNVIPGFARTSPPAGVRFNAVTAGLPPAAVAAAGVSVAARSETDVLLARSARRLWMPFRATYAAVPEAWTDPTSGTDGGLAADRAFDGWDHKELNVFLADPTATTPPPMLNPDSLALAAGEDVVAAGPGTVALVRDYLFVHQEERPTTDPDPTFDDLLPPPDPPFVLRFPDWPKVLPRAAPRTADQGRVGRPHAVALGLEHRYGTALFPASDGGGDAAWNLDFTPWVDWPLDHPAAVVRRYDGEDRALVEFDLAGPTAVRLTVRGDWTTTAAPSATGDQPARQVREARRAAAEFDTVGAATLRVVAVRFNLLHREDAADGTGHDEPFDRKLEVVYDETVPVPAAAVAAVRAALHAAAAAEVDVAVPPVPASAHLARCELTVTRRPELTPTDAALADYRVFRPDLGRATAAAGLTLTPDDVLKSDRWKDKFEPVADPAAQAALRAFFGTVRTAARPLLPTGGGRSALHRRALRALMRDPHWLAPAGLAAEAGGDVRYAIVPLAFLPVAPDPVYSEATAEVVRLLLGLAAGYDALTLDGFAGFDRGQWRDFFADGGRLPGMDGVRDAVARTLQPVAADRPPAADRLAPELARGWRTADPAAALTWPQGFVRRRLADSWAAYAELKALLVHALRGESAGDPIPAAFERLTVDKDANEQTRGGGAPGQPLGRDVDVFPYRTTTTFGPANGGPSPPVLLAADPLDDLTYDNQFAVAGVAIGSAEEYVESLGTPFWVADTFAAELDAWATSAQTLRAEFAAVGLPTGTATTAAPDADGGWAFADPAAGGGSGRTFLITRDTDHRLRVDLAGWAGRVFALKDGVVDLPFGPPRPPGPTALVPLIARRPAARPRLVYQGVPTRPRLLGDEPTLGDLDTLPDGSDPATHPPAFDRVGGPVVGPDWPAGGAADELDAAVIALALVIEADEEGELERDQLWLAQAPPPADPPPGADPAGPLTAVELDGLRTRGPAAFPPLDVRGKTSPAGGPLPDWLAAAVARSVGVAADRAADPDGRLTFVTGPALGPADLGRLPNRAVRATLFRPRTAGRKAYVLVFETVGGVGDRYDGLTFRQTRNEANRTGVADGATPFEPDPRFVVLTRPAERPDPVVLTHDVRVSDLYGLTAPADLARVPAVRLPVDPAAGLSLNQLLDAIEALPPAPDGSRLRFRGRPRLTTARVRAAVDHAGVVAAPLLDVDPATGRGRVKGGADGAVRRYGHSARIVRVNEPGGPGPDDPAFALPPTYPRYLMTLTFAGPAGDILIIRDLPAVPAPGG